MSHPEHLERAVDILEDALRKVALRSGLRGFDIQVDFRLWNHLITELGVGSRLLAPVGYEVIELNLPAGKVHITRIDYPDEPVHTGHGTRFHGGSL